MSPPTAMATSWARTSATGQDWAALEADARRDWEARHPSTWDRFKDAIRYGWDKVRART